MLIISIKSARSPPLLPHICTKFHLGTACYPASPSRGHGTAVANSVRPSRNHGRARRVTNKVPSGQSIGEKADWPLRNQPLIQQALSSSASGQHGGSPQPNSGLAAYSLESRVVVVTGGARGLGLAMAKGLVGNGANVAIVDLNRESGILWTVQRL